jgi:hypothetical protein
MQYSVDQQGTKKVIRHWADGEAYEQTNQSEVAFEGKCRVVTSADDFFGGEDSRKYRGPVIESPTWRRLFGEAKRSQAKTLDYHHDFFEGAIVATVDAKGVKVLHLLLGS